MRMPGTLVVRTVVEPCPTRVHHLNTPRGSTTYTVAAVQGNRLRNALLQSISAVPQQVRMRGRHTCSAIAVVRAVNCSTTASGQPRRASKAGEGKTVIDRYLFITMCLSANYEYS